MKQNKKRALFYVLLFVLGVVFGLTKINGQAEDGYLLKADEKGNDDLIYNYPLEKDQGVSEEYLVGRSTLEGFRLSVGRNQKDIRFDVKIEEKGGGITREWKDLKNHGQMGYSYEYKNTGKLYDDYTDGKIIIKIKYYNKELKKNVEIWINPWEGIESREKILLKD